MRRIPNEAGTPAAPQSDVENQQKALEERIERLEKRLDETLAGTGTGHVRSDHGPDPEERRDSLRKAVDKALEKRGQ